MYELFKDKNIVTDRHLASNYAWSGTDYNTDVYDLVSSKIGKPKLTVILYSTKEVIVDRLKKRDLNDKDISRASQSEEIYSKMKCFCEKYNFPYILIDTSNITPNEVVEIIIKELENNG